MIETVVAITILLVGIVGAVSLATFGIRAAGESRDRVIATNLAREGLEVVRNIRDTNWYENRFWLSGLTRGAYEISFNPNDSSMTLDPIEGTERIFDPNNPETAQNSTTQVFFDGVYLQFDPRELPSPFVTNFYRMITLTPNVADEILEVHAYVVWQDSSGSQAIYHIVDLEEYLYNWYPVTEAE